MSVGANVNPRATHRRTSEADWQPAGIELLEPSAWKALKNPLSVLVAAGPGAGKTEFLAQKASFLFETEACGDPFRILAISYKRESASNLKNRVDQRTPRSAARFTSVTFDAFTKGLLDRFHRSMPIRWHLKGSTYSVKQSWAVGEIRSFLARIEKRFPDLVRPWVHSVDPRHFISDVVGAWQLPIDPSAIPDSPAEFAARWWWIEKFAHLIEPELDFTMINRLADLAVRSNPRIARAIQSTYPFVFVDEFQDTTCAQIEFLESAFGGGRCMVTAVGDDKQRIMKFAGAAEDAMGRFSKSFDAARYDLEWNFRSSAELVRIQHGVGSRLQPDSVHQQSRILVEDEAFPLHVWRFADQESQAKYIAHCLDYDIKNAGLRASDFAILARQKVADLAAPLSSAMNDRGLVLRNDDQRFGVFARQDLLKNEISRLLLGLWRLALSPKGDIEVWNEVHSLVCQIALGETLPSDDPRAPDLISRIARTLASWCIENDAHSSAGQLIAQICSLLPVHEMVQFVRLKHRGDSLNLITDALTLLVQNHALPGSSWLQVLSEIEGTDSVSLMTIHRSKGLEYHTVFVVGFDDRQWWSYEKDPHESLAVFFVGLSRAARRIVLTRTDQEPNSGPTEELYAMLKNAGAEELRKS